MIKGLIITPPVLGRISIGRVVEKNGKRLPSKDDQFTITSQIQNKDGWINHPINAVLREGSDGKLRKIPVRMLFNDPELNLRAEYTLFDRQTGRPVCVGDGEQCQRRTGQGVEQLPCPSPDRCPLAQGVACKPYGRLYVNLSEDDELGTFIFRTTGFNSIRTLAARLSYFAAVSGNKLSCLPLQLTLRGKSTTQSYRTPIYFVDLTLREGLTLKDAVQDAQSIYAELGHHGFDQEALEATAKRGYGNSIFEMNDAEALEVIEEFYPAEQDNDHRKLQHQPPSEISSNAIGSIEKGLRQSVTAVR
ncbi:hydrolase or metal-binding protein [Psychrobacter proteolyticus]|uniref:Hydrolase or metal-binding protein n=1 Tax=Psychrobacter proteolyticus TaxID=147825 RepID=A0ABV0D6R7_9GAMM